MQYTLMMNGNSSYQSSLLLFWGSLSCVRHWLKPWKSGTTNGLSRVFPSARSVFPGSTERPRLSSSLVTRRHCPSQLLRREFAFMSLTLCGSRGHTSQVQILRSWSSWAPTWSYWSWKRWRPRRRRRRLRNWRTTWWQNTCLILSFLLFIYVQTSQL